MPEIFNEPLELRAWCRSQRLAGHTIGFVPTMGNLHAGHLSLMKHAVAENDVAVCSIFVNPIQFGPQEDFNKYPRTFEADVAKATEVGVRAIFAPTPGTMYPEGFATSVEVHGITEVLCGAARPGHFKGVATVCTKFHCLVWPTRAYYGEKDYQQLQVIRRMTEDLGLDVEIVGVQLVREPDGLAMSSRNQYLSGAEREAALGLSRGLAAAQKLAAESQTTLKAEEVEKAAADVINANPLAKVEYAQLVHPT